MSTEAKYLYTGSNPFVKDIYDDRNKQWEKQEAARKAAEEAKEKRDNISDQEYFGSLLQGADEKITNAQFDLDNDGNVSPWELRHKLKQEGFKMKHKQRKYFRKYLNEKDWDKSYPYDVVNDYVWGLDTMSAKQRAAEAPERLRDSRQAMINDQIQRANGWVSDSTNANAIKTMLGISNLQTIDGNDKTRIQNIFKNPAEWTHGFLKDSNGNVIDKNNPYLREAIRNMFIKGINNKSITGLNVSDLGSALDADSDEYYNYNTQLWNSKDYWNTGTSTYNTFNSDNAWKTRQDAARKKAQEEREKRAMRAQFSGYSYSYNKQGGKMNTRYYQEGGAAPKEAAQNLQTQVVQLVQAAMSGDKKAAKAIEQIVAAAKQGDEQAVQLAQMIQAVAEQLEQGQAQAAKMGAKLSYLHSLKTGCPSGYEVAYRKQGGHICKECVKKNQEGQQLTEAERKAKGIGTPEQVEAAARRNKRKYPQYTMDQCRGAAPIIKNGKEYYMGGDGSITPAKKSVSKHQFGGHPEPRHVVPTVSGTGNDRLLREQLAQLAAEEDYKGKQLADIYYATEAAKARKAMLAARELNRIQAAKATPTVAVPTTPVAVVEQVPMEVEGTVQGLPVVVHKKGGCLKRKLCKGKKVVGKNAAGGYVQMHKSDPAGTTEQGETTGTTQGTITGGPEKKRIPRNAADLTPSISDVIDEEKKKSEENKKQNKSGIAVKKVFGQLPPRPADNVTIIDAEPISAETGNWLREARLQREINELKRQNYVLSTQPHIPYFPAPTLGFGPAPMEIEGKVKGMVPATYRWETAR